MEKTVQSSNEDRLMPWMIPAQIKQFRFNVLFRSSLQCSFRLHTWKPRILTSDWRPAVKIIIDCLNAFWECEKLACLDKCTSVFKYGSIWTFMPFGDYCKYVRTAKLLFMLFFFLIRAKVWILFLANHTMKCNFADFQTALYCYEQCFLILHVTWT